MSFSESENDAESDSEHFKTDKMSGDSKKVKFGAFQSMGLSPAVLKGILRRGYRLATPIQRKTIPHILAGRDVVGMSRTGSGKTAAFLIPMFEKLKQHLPSSGPRALIISPARDLALQTARFVKELGKFTDLRTAVIIGGERMEDQFTILHSEPDILLVTPGRLLHIMLEMDLKLSSVNYLIFDEADRLFELGFSSQVSEILSRTAADRQTLLFSATLPSAVAEFVSAGLHNPLLMRLDVDTKLSPQLSIRHLLSAPSDKLALLIYLLKNMSNEVGNRKTSAAVFCATRYHVDYLHAILTQCGILSTCAYSSMDPTARKINMAKFRMGQATVLVVTDVAARGIDIPELDIVINFNFPSQPKLFIHRVGRAARAGRCGTAYSLVSPDELPYLMDLHMFLGHQIKLSSPSLHSDSSVKENSSVVEIGHCPRSVIDHCCDLLRNIVSEPEIEQQAKAVENALTKYIKMRPSPSPEAVRQSKKLVVEGSKALHSMFAKDATAQDSLYDQIRSYKPKDAFVALMSTGNKQVVQKFIKSKNIKPGKPEQKVEDKMEEGDQLKEEPSESRLQFNEIDGTRQKKKSTQKKKDQFFVPYMPKSGADSEFRLSAVAKDSVASATLDIADDERLKSRRTAQAGGDKRMIRVWHRQAKKFVTIDLAAKADGTKCRVKTESGRWIPSSYQTKKYEQWKKKNLNAVEADRMEASNYKGLLGVAKKQDWRNKKKKHGSGKVNKGKAASKGTAASAQKGNRSYKSRAIRKN